MKLYSGDLHFFVILLFYTGGAEFKSFEELAIRRGCRSHRARGCMQVVRETQVSVFIHCICSSMRSWFKIFSMYGGMHACA